MDYITPSGEITEEGRAAEKAGKVKFVKEDLDPNAMDNPENEIKDFDQKETGATEEQEEQFEDKTKDIIVAIEKE
jgi:hypothetical protein